MKTISTCLACALIFSPASGFAQQTDRPEPIVIEKEVDLDQIQKVRPRRAIKPRLPFDDSEVLDQKALGNNTDDAEGEARAVQEEKAQDPQLLLNEKEIIQINNSLKSIINENQKLKVQAQELDKELRYLRGQRTIEINRMNTLMIERDTYKKQSRDIEAVKDRVMEYAEQREKEIGEREKFLTTRIRVLEQQLAAPLKEEIAQEKKMAAAPESTVKLASDKDKTQELLEMVDSLKEGIRKVKQDKAKVHYNMGNTYFENREYPKAIREYKKAIDIFPDDAYAHFNLAYVSSEYMYDHKTAVIHYQKYLNLMPNAQDFRLVREKIIEAEFHLKSNIDSMLINDLKRSKSEIFKGQ